MTIITDQPVAVTEKSVRDEQQQVLQRLEQALKNNDAPAFMQAVNDFFSLKSVINYIRDCCRYRLDYRESWQGSISDSQDLEQEVKIKFLLALDRLNKFHPGSVKAYLRQIAHHVCIDGIRQYRRERELTVPLEDDFDLPITLSQGTEPKLDKAMESLKPGDREILKMKFVHGFSLDEIADRTGMSRSNVHSRLRRALERLRGIMST
ncbi:MAG TPA: sigma-70 family RNA polymerase sigma factor [Blastocatellia bacterium]|nr:sigma-70 family RNA polymerase sigma factor [Blastocatellia bacterium]